MQFSDTTTKGGLVQDLERKLFADDYGFISDDATRLKTFTQYINRALSEVSVIVLMSDGDWSFDDYNETTMPVGRTNLVSGQAQYALDTQHIVVDRVVVKDSNGDGHELEPLSLAEIDGDPEEFLEEDGDPRYYVKRGSNIVLYPAPNYAATSGLVVYFRREMDAFASSDTTKTPGFNPAFHELVTLIAAAAYAEDKNLANAKTFRDRATAMTPKLGQFNARRGRDAAKKMTPKQNRSR
jgi:hypothetical protein